MHIRISFLLAALLLFAGGRMDFARAEAGDDAASAALTWLKVVDDGDYAGSWKQAADFFKNAVKQDVWESQVKAVRGPIGALVSRKESSREHALTLPGAPDGEYYVLKFTTVFANKKAAVETITMVREKDNVWRVTGYFIR